MNEPNDRPLFSRIRPQAPGHEALLFKILLNPGAPAARSEPATYPDLDSLHCFLEHELAFEPLLFPQLKLEDHVLGAAGDEGEGLVSWSTPGLTSISLHRRLDVLHCLVIVIEDLEGDDFDAMLLQDRLTELSVQLQLSPGGVSADDGEVAGEERLQLLLQHIVRSHTDQIGPVH